MVEPASAFLMSSFAEPMIAPNTRVTENAGERTRTEGREHQEDRDRQAGVANAVHHERLLRRRSGGRLELPEPDEQVRGEADTFPAEVEAEVVVGEHEQQHGGDEQ